MLTMLMFGAHVVVFPANRTHVLRCGPSAILREGRNLPEYMIPEAVATRKLETRSRPSIKSYVVEM